MRARRAAALALSVAAAGCASAPHYSYPHPPAQGFYAREFDAFWDNYARYYPYFEYKHVDWNAQYRDFRPRVDRIRSQRDLIALLQEMIAPLRDVHSVFVRPDGKLMPSYRPPVTPNWDYSAIYRYVSERYRYPGEEWLYGRIGDIGYLMIPTWTEPDFSLRHFDRALAELGRSAAIIIDVRMNGGGDDTLAYAVASRFAERTRITEYLQYRDGPAFADLTPLEPRRVHPRWFWQYRRPVALLIGPGCFSSNESFIAAMQTLPNVTTIGATTGGASGNPRFFDLGEGWRYSVPTWIDYTAGKQIIEWRGIKPEMAVAATAADFRRGDDPVLDAALKLLRGKIAAATSASR